MQVPSHSALQELPNFGDLPKPAGRADRGGESVHDASEFGGPLQQLLALFSGEITQFFRDHDLGLHFDQRPLGPAQIMVKFSGRIPRLAFGDIPGNQNGRAPQLGR